ncbi:MAG: aconitate hydratase AcnA [Candidatus Omnitrophica bacterium]|nr:aconitate hydratase AcnA [Candidatus Omnitrophota bacterium]
MSTNNDIKSIESTLRISGKIYKYYKLDKLKDLGFKKVSKLPFSIRVLLESVARNCDDYQITMRDVEKICRWSPTNKKPVEIAYKPGRVILQDFTGVPCVVDLAAMRSAMKRLGGDIKKINPQIPCDLVIDHSIQVDAFGSKRAMTINVNKEYRRNKERYEFLKWGQNVFKNFRVVPPSTGIIHQVNLEYLAKGVLKTKIKNDTVIYPDSLVGTDSHTTMINGLGIVGWGVGGIEAEAVMLGEPIYMLLPEVVGFELTGKLAEGVTATDLVLTVVEMLRQKGVVGKFVEFYGGGIDSLSLADRATVSNMCPEYGATIGIFPVDDETLRYYKMTGRSGKEVELVEKYMKAQGLFYDGKKNDIVYSDNLKLRLDSVEPCLAGPKRPQDRIPLKKMRKSFQSSLTAPIKERGFGLPAGALAKPAPEGSKEAAKLNHGAVVIAAITSCTNTSNPAVLVSAGLLARKAVEKGLKVPEYVKTSLSPGSRVVDDYLKDSGLMAYLEKLGFHNAGYGCATCIGNSGPLPQKVTDVIQKNGLVVSSVVSGNRNFEGRINPLTRANYLASPPLVVAYALAGTVDIDLLKQPIALDKRGKGVYLNDLWPKDEEVRALCNKYVTAKSFRKRYKNVSKSNEKWNAVKADTDTIYKWKEKSAYIQEPPFFADMTLDVNPIENIDGARVLVSVGDSITTDHISPAGVIARESPAGRYLKELKIAPEDFNSYGSRRGNDRVMTRGTFANIRLRNQLAPGTEGSWTIYFPKKEKMSIFDAAQLYKKDQTPLIVLAGKEYGTGSSRDWAAKGAALLGVRIVIAESYERIHRSNLAGMGVLPLTFMPGESIDSLGLKGDGIFDFEGINDSLKPRQIIKVTAVDNKGKSKQFDATCRLDTPVEIDYFRNGGILQTVLRKLA